MARICKRCQRINPIEAVFCYHDGHLLEEKPEAVGPVVETVALDVGALPFGTPFTLPSGRVCDNFNQLKLAFVEDSATAHALLQNGNLEAFLCTLGRSDLASAANAAGKAGDPVRALDEFLARLPGSNLNPPRLRVETTVIDLGILRPGEGRRCELTLRNEGMKLLYGSASCSETPWLILGEKPGQRCKFFQFTDKTTVLVRIRGRHVRAYPGPQEGEVRLETNGGTIVVPVRFEVPIEPFPEGVLAGATTPRQLAEKAAKAAKEAARLVESGAVQRWYQTNGWLYPVSGPPASGPAAVQQYFEALGVSSPPRVSLSEETIELSSVPEERIEYVLTVHTQDNRPAVAHGKSDQAGCRWARRSIATEQRWCR